MHFHHCVVVAPPCHTEEREDDTNLTAIFQENPDKLVPACHLLDLIEARLMVGHVCRMEPHRLPYIYCTGEWKDRDAEVVQEKDG